MNRHRPRILSLDGGAVDKGWSQILLLERIIYNIKMKEKVSTVTNESSLDGAVPNQLSVEGEVTNQPSDTVTIVPLSDDENCYPSDYFDLIMGTGMGGINAIMIGRLGMSIVEMEKAHQDLKKRVFQTIIAESDDDPLFSFDELEKWAKDLARDYTGDAESRMIPDPKIGYGNKRQKSCKTCVTSLRSVNKTLPALFRSYRARASPGPNCTIWEAIRATTASPMLFESIKISGFPYPAISYIGAESCANNPVQYLKDESDQVFASPGRWGPPPVGCIVSLGTGKGAINSLGDYEIDEKEAKGKLYTALLKMQQDCERAHHAFKESNTADGKKVYFRFNIEQGMQGVMSYDLKQDQSILAQAKAYMEHEDYTRQFEELGDRYVELMQEEKGF